MKPTRALCNNVSSSKLNNTVLYMTMPPRQKKKKKKKDITVNTSHVKNKKYKKNKKIKKFNCKTRPFLLNLEQFPFYPLSIYYYVCVGVLLQREKLERYKKKIM